MYPRLSTQSTLYPLAFLSQFLIYTSLGLILTYSGIAQAVNEQSVTRHIQPRIIGGKPVSDAQQYPWIVHIQAQVDNKLNLCSGTLIDESWVLTAAHCLYMNQRLVNPGQLQLTRAEYHLYQDTERESQHTAVQFIIHPEFDINDSYFEHDLALIKLDNVVMGAPLLSLASPTIETNTQLAGESLKIMGWGIYQQAGQQQLPNILQEADINLIAKGQCTNAYPNLTDAHLCAGSFDRAVDSCTGDSGGPLIFHDGGQWTQVGIVSFGKRCAQRDAPGIYTNLGHYSHWIRSQIERDNSLLRLSIIDGPSVKLIAGSGLKNAAPERLPSSGTPQESAAEETATAPSSSGGGGGGTMHFSYLFIVLLLGYWRYLTAGQKRVHHKHANSR